MSEFKITDIDYIQDLCANGQFSAFYKSYVEVITKEPYRLTEIYEAVRDISNGAKYIQLASSKYQEETFTITKLSK